MNLFRFWKSFAESQLRIIRSVWGFVARSYLTDKTVHIIRRFASRIFGQHRNCHGSYMKTSKVRKFQFTKAPVPNLRENMERSSVVKEQGERSPIIESLFIWCNIVSICFEPHDAVVWSLDRAAPIYKRKNSTYKQYLMLTEDFSKENEDSQSIFRYQFRKECRDLIVDSPVHNWLLKF